MIAIGLLFIVIGCIIVYWNIPYSPYKNSFMKQMEERVDQTKGLEAVCTKEEIDALPEPLKKYCLYIGLENFEKFQALRTVFTNTKFVFDATSGKELNMNYDLWLFYDVPFRSAYCQSSMYGVPFDGIDYSNDHLEGGMKGILGKAIKIFDVSNKQGYQAGIISWFAESLTFNPSALFSPYVEYEIIDNLHVKVIITSNGVSGTGVITFNELGAVTEFYSDDRQVEKINGIETSIGWRCEYEDYREEHGILQAHAIRCIKVYPEKELIYFESNNIHVEYKK